MVAQVERTVDLSGGQAMVGQLEEAYAFTCVADLVR